MTKYKLNKAELFYKKQLEKKGYKFIEKDGEKPIIIAEPLSNEAKETLGISPENTKRLLERFKNSPYPYFLDTNGMLITNWMGYL